MGGQHPVLSPILPFAPFAKGFFTESDDRAQGFHAVGPKAWPGKPGFRRPTATALRLCSKLALFWVRVGYTPSFEAG